MHSVAHIPESTSKVIDQILCLLHCSRLMTLHGQHKSVSFWSLCVPCYLVDSVDEKLPGLFAVG